MSSLPITAIEIATAVRSGSLSAREVLDDHLSRIEEREGEIHAFNLVMVDEAKAAAEAVDALVAAGGDPGPLAGVPLALKDNLCTRGIPTTCSSRILEGWRPPYDATVVQRVNAAGACSTVLVRARGPAEETFRQIDRDGGGQILFEEFCSWLERTHAPVD